MLIPRPTTLTVLIVGLFASVTLALAVPVGAITQRNLYSYKKGSECREPARIDPVTVIFRGSHATARGVGRNLRAHLGWTFADDPSPQNFYQSGRCRRQDASRASADGTSTRFHVRYRRNRKRMSNGNWSVFATPHHEDWIDEFPPDNPFFDNGCHAVDKGTAEEPTPMGSGFDQGRRRVASGFVGSTHSPHTYVYRGNTDTFKQCDDDFAGSNGVVVYIPVAHTH